MDCEMHIYYSSNEKGIWHYFKNFNHRFRQRHICLTVHSFFKYKDFLLFICSILQGDGPKLVRELFRVAEEHAPSIVFIDEIDAVGTKRYDSNSGGEREIQRTMLELLNQLDGFDSRGDVKVKNYN